MTQLEPNQEAPFSTFSDLPSVAFPSRTSPKEPAEDPDLLCASPEESEEENDIGGDLFRSILPGDPGLEQDPWPAEEEEEDEES